MSTRQFIKIIPLFFLLFSLGVSEIMAATVKMHLVIVNPSTTKTQTKTIKNYLPKEVKLADIVDNGGLDVDYDAEQGAFFVFKNDLVLAPGETKTFEILMQDVWNIPQTRLEDSQKRTESIMENLKDTAYFEQGDLIAKTIYGRLAEIDRTQNDINASKQQHIAYYRENMKVMETVQADIEQLEKILVAVGGAPNLAVIEDSDVNLKSPTSKTTWIIIFVILIFIAILGGAFYFTWQGQAKVTENIFTREKDNTFAEFKKSSDENKKVP